MVSSNSTVCLTFDFDALCIWLGPRASLSPSAISRGEFAVVGVQRILKVLATRGITGTFFIPGHTVETYPDSVKAIIAAGHEVGHHGYLHENPCALPSRDAERDILLRGFEAFDKVAGVRPEGYRSPAWDNSPHTIELLLDQGFTYESSLMAHDFRPYWCRVGDEAVSDGPYRFGTPVDLVEMPVSWVLDDFPHFEFLRSGATVYPGLSAGSKVEEIWQDEFDFMVREEPGGVFNLTMHPEIIGRGYRILMLERLIDHMRENAEVQFTSLGAAAKAFRAKHAGSQ
jgi:peptidoglycan/xylan/chitin deacetylase (PgdA/CDA1 family)